jgi:hypothetical protein
VERGPALVVAFVAAPFDAKDRQDSAYQSSVSRMRRRTSLRLVRLLLQCRLQTTSSYDPDRAEYIDDVSAHSLTMVSLDGETNESFMRQSACMSGRALAYSVAENGNKEAGSTQASIRVQWTAT